MQTIEQAGKVAAYFDRISGGYTARYGDQNPFHNYFFRQRLRAATDGLLFDGKSVLDIGAGTGALYDELTLRSPSMDYFACDLSQQMLAQSAIPPDRSFVGSVSEIDFPRQCFDFIFSLGVTTYQAPAELARNWRFIGDRLAPKGVAVISFTNRASIDHALRSAMKVAKPFVSKGVFGQSFATFSYRASDVKEMARSVGLRVTRTAFLNHAFSPFNRLLPRPSVAFAKAIERRAPTAMLPRLSSDFIVFAERA